SPSAYAYKRLLAHQTSDPFRRHTLAGFFQLGVHARPPVGPARELVNRTDPRPELGIPLRTGRDRTLQPLVVPAGGDLQHTAHGGDRILSLVSSHELEDFDAVTSVSRANQAAAFARISRSRR